MNTEDTEISELEEKKNELLIRRRKADNALRKISRQLSEANYKKTQQIKFIVGYATALECELNSDFRDALISRIRKHITRETDKAALTGSIFDLNEAINE